MGTSKRTTVLFNMDDYGLIKAEVTRRTEESGYPVTVADVLRDLVREKWKGNDDTKITRHSTTGTDNVGIGTRMSGADFRLRDGKGGI